MEGAGFEPAKAGPADLQSALVDRLSTPPFFGIFIIHLLVKLIIILFNKVARAF